MDTGAVPMVSLGAGTGLVGKEKEQEGAPGVGKPGLMFLEVVDNYDRVRRREKAHKLMRATCQRASERPVSRGLRRSRQEIFQEWGQCGV